MEDLVTRASGNADMKPRYADPVSLQWAQFLWDGGSLDAVPEEFREEAGLFTKPQKSWRNCMPNIGKRIQRLEKSLGISDGQCHCYPVKVLVLCPENTDSYRKGEGNDRRCELCGKDGVIIKVLYEQGG